ncbi:MAG: tRNA 5-methoxyuridine(34)/uridine 5-oxyacetic acid(34) synthase CmoB [Methylococcales bacterium]
MIDNAALKRSLEVAGLDQGIPILMDCIDAALASKCHGDWPKWLALLESLPELPIRESGLNEARIRVESTAPLDPQQRANLYEKLQKLHPWRKGPYLIHGIHIDSEWRSDLKWNRLCDAISPLARRRVLDVGCGNGYHCWRMIGAGAQLVIGIDPSLLSVVQFWTIRHLVGDFPVFVLPLSGEQFPAGVFEFDTVFSMGVMVHRKSPLDHLGELHGMLRPSGELVLESLVVDGAEGHALVPEDRYAMMRNVWFIPSCPTLFVWLKRCGFDNIRLIDLSTTTSVEQRSTEWMRFQSLADFLDPKDKRLSREGLPAPKRAIVIANKPWR